jgi:L-fuculose-phosphate aldolase
MSDHALRAEIVALARELDARGLNRGTSGNLSARDGGAILVTPSGIPAGALEPEMLARMPLDSDDGTWQGPMKPSTEWRFHRDLMRARPEFNAIVHTHSPFATILAIARRPIPAIHYMMAAFGGPEIRCSDYACFGTAALSQAVVAAMDGRAGCLMANHGMIVGGPTLARAGWLAQELEALAHQYLHALQIGGGYVLSAAEVAEAAEGFAGYGPRPLRG